MSHLRRSLRTVKSEPKTRDLDEGDDNQRNNAKDIIYCDVTLKELKKCCKRKKKKLHKSVGSLKKDADNSSSVGDNSRKKSCPILLVKEEEASISSEVGDYSSKGSCPSLRVKEDEPDLEEPLIYWKLKKSKKARVKKNSSGKRVSSSYKVSVLTEKISSATTNLPKDVENMLVPANIKIEIPETELATVSNDSKSVHCEKIGPCREFSDTDGVHGVVSCNKIQSRELDLACTSNDSINECCDGIDIHQNSFSEVPNIVTRGNVENVRHAPCLIKDYQNCVTNEASFEFSELCEFPSVPLSNEMMFGNNVETDFSFSSFEDTREGDINNQPISLSISEKNPVTDRLSLDISSSVGGPDTIGTDSFTEHTCQMNWDLAQLPLASTDELHYIEHIYSYDSCVSDLESEAVSSGKILHLNGSSTYSSRSPTMPSLDSQPISSADSSADSPCDGSPTSLEKSSFLTTDGTVNASIDGTLDCSRRTLDLDASECAAAKEMLENHQLHLRSSPKRLPLKRKVISPTSREKLCNSMSNEIYDNSLQFKPALNGFEVTLSPSKVVKKSKNHRNGSPQSVPKGILKAARSFLVPHEGSDSPFIHSSAHKAIAFSQRQMHDIDCLAMKLLNELKFMKDIVEETWCSNVHSSMPSRYTSDELRLTIENAGKVEETTKKWLSMMAKDCNRFCKIMRTSEKVTSSHDIHKERKKITFADEAGGMLCHVKVFEDRPAPSLVISRQNADLSTQVFQD
ncbi:hypothetical protein Scep_000763 [Stephania cephalantha]|uniref:Uncharacterized protein n=1 Tax=Stephania cephalantha TaxID=152367 RepID=A0AAP0L883_9MAGN